MRFARFSRIHVRSGIALPRAGERTMNDIRAEFTSGDGNGNNLRLVSALCPRNANANQKFPRVRKNILLAISRY